VRQRLPPTHDGRAQRARDQSNNPEPPDRIDGGGVGLIPQRIYTESIRIRAVEPAAAFVNAAEVLRRCRMLTGRVARLVKRDFFGRLFQYSASANCSGRIVPLRCCAPQGALPQLFGQTHFATTDEYTQCWCLAAAAGGKQRTNAEFPVKQAEFSMCSGCRHL
jgi:hypothetical protein